MATFDETVETVDARPPSFGSGGESSGAGGESSGPGSSVHSGTIALTGTQPADALRLEEVERTRKFMLLTVAICVAMGTSVPLLSGHPTIQKYLVPAIVVTGLLAAFLYYHFRDPENYSTAKITPFAAWLAAMTFGGVVYWGVFSAAPSMVVMGIYFFSRTQSLGAALFVYFECALIQGIASSLFLVGVMPDPGMYPMPDLPVWELLVSQGIVQMIYLATFWIARSTRRSTVHAIEKLQIAARKIAQREALFQEVRQELDAALKVGGAGRYTDQVFGAYKLGALIGRGAMGEVYEAAHQETGEPAAVKLLHAHILDSPTHVTRFFREAKAAAALDSPHVIEIFEMSDAMASVPYMIMERLRGHDLAHHLRAKRRLSRRELVQMLKQVGSAVDVARDKGIVHRDLKPQNLLLAEQPGGDDIWKILDFGVSKLGEGGGTLTQGNVVGTPVYMAPEQARGEAVDHRADLYALAAIAYRCLTGRPPFSGKDVPTILYNVVYQMPPRPSDFAELYTDIDYALALGLAKRPADRFDTAAELTEAIRLALRGDLDSETKQRAVGLLSTYPWDNQHAA